MPEPPAGTQAFTQALDRDETLVPMTWEGLARHASAP